MLIVMNTGATDAQIDGVVGVIESIGLHPHVMAGAARTAIGITGNTRAVDRSRFESLPGVAEAIRVSKPYELTSLDARPQRTIVHVAGAKIGGGSLALIAGPCS